MKNNPIKKVPNIAIVSYLGKGTAQQKLRLDFHLQQREQLAELFPKMKILSICSGYTPKTQKALLDFDCIFLEGRVKKYVKHAMLFQSLYKSRNLKSVLVLDDDVLPTSMVQFPTVGPVQVLTEWLSVPSLIPAPCIYFSCKNLFTDSFYQGRKGLVTAPLQCPGWAMMIRSDLEVIPTKESIEQDMERNSFLSDDTAFRVQCSAEGKEVLKHETLFFRTLQNTTKYEQSTAAPSHEVRKRSIELYSEWFWKKYPWLFDRAKNGQLKFIWARGNKHRRMMLSAGELIRTRHGFVPVPSKLKEKLERKQNSRVSLLDL